MAKLITGRVDTKRSDTLSTASRVHLVSSRFVRLRNRHASDLKSVGEDVGSYRWRNRAIILCCCSRSFFVAVHSGPSALFLFSPTLSPTSHGPLPSWTLTQ